ncbi:hypothetical protein RFI_34430 [Reticulomyxa filosa]|uniref:Uncharacterized protein n=1 Tax=Reticulomyxa filosa TaxID=46433 RepID=X6LQG7_RETFI|nr:hypothetical protein RFI_34430 [Reticulomyxa filosa]|eukprot:ETO02980.1 hypothetical protein RFI_34430 [Reticulomyxa filosa]
MSTQNLKDLPIPLSDSKCILYKHELLICGDFKQRDYYSYHTLKDEYKFICEYPSDITVEGHCAVMTTTKSLCCLLENLNIKETSLVMNYVSVWSKNNRRNTFKKREQYNQWIHFTNDQNNTICIGRNEDDYRGVRAMIGYYKNNISMFNLNTFQCIKHDTLSTNDWTCHHCFVSKSKNGQEKNSEMILYMMNKVIFFNFINYLSVMILQKLTDMHTCISMTLPCSFVDVMVIFSTLLSYIQCINI